MRKRPPQIYDKGMYRDFGEPPIPLELQIGCGLMPLADEQGDGSLLDAIQFVRNEIDGEYGLPLPPVRIRDNACLEPYEYKILLHGIFVAEERAEEAERLGYAVVEPVHCIQTHLSEIIKKNITKFLNQCMVNTLVNKVRDSNPDVVDDVFFMHQFSTSRLKTILNWLLEEDVSIRDMNAILEAVADNIHETKRPVELMERVREELAWQFLPKFADKDKDIHVILVSGRLCEALEKRMYCPQSQNALPYCALSPEERKAFVKEIAEKVCRLKEKGYEPLFLVASSLRTAFANTIRLGLGNWSCISDTELQSGCKEYALAIEEELEVDEIRVNETCYAVD